MFKELGYDWDKRKQMKVEILKLPNSVNIETMVFSFNRKGKKIASCFQNVILSEVFFISILFSLFLQLGLAFEAIVSPKENLIYHKKRFCIEIKKQKVSSLHTQTSFRSDSRFLLHCVGKNFTTSWSFKLTSLELGAQLQLSDI